MIRLSTTTMKLQAWAAATVAASQPVVTVNYSDQTTSAYGGGVALSTLTNTTAVDICAAPGTNTVRDIDYVSVFNKDTSDATVTVAVVSGTSTYEGIKTTLNASDTLQYIHGHGWRVIDVNGQSKNSNTATMLFRKTEGTATAGQTSITATYTPGYVDVFVNGVRLAESDITATSGSSITVPAMTAGDVYNIVAWIPATSIAADAIQKTLIDAKGDLIVGTADNTPGKLSVGSNGKILIADSAQTTGLAYASVQVGKNALINGAFDIWQRGTSFAGLNAYGPDRWAVLQSNDATTTAAQSGTVPTLAEAGVLFNYSLSLTASVADASIAAGQYCVIQQIIEGFNWKHFAQRDLILSFWVRSPKTGTHCVAVRNSGADRSFIAEYTVNAANTWEKKTVSITASPSAGTWNYTNGIGARVSFALAVGSTFQGSAGWSVGNFFGSSSQVNCLDTNGNVFYITGVQLELGSVATDFHHRPIATEIELCERYYQKTFALATAPAQNVGIDTGEMNFQALGAASSAGARWLFRTRMRATPSTVTTYNPAAANAQARNRGTSADCSSTNVVNSSDTGCYVFCTTDGGASSGNAIAVHLTAEAEL